MAWIPRQQGWLPLYGQALWEGAYPAGSEIADTLTHHNERRYFITMPVSSLMQSASALATIPLSYRPMFMRGLSAARIAHEIAKWCLVVLGCTLLVTAALAQTSVTGTIAAGSHWSVENSPYLVSGDVVVQDGTVLTIDAGVTVFMAADASLTVQSGGINALGTQANPIRVLSDKTRLAQAALPGDWKQWVFNPGAINTRLDHVIFEHGRGLVVNGSAPTLNYLNLRNNQGAAITIDLAASLSGIGNQATGNTVNGIMVPAGVITGGAKWGLKGIPFVVASGAISVGVPPEITTINHTPLEQGRTATYELSGKRLGGLVSINLTRSSMAPRVLTATADQIRFEVDAPINAALGPVDITLLVDAGEASMVNAFPIILRQPKLVGFSPTRVMVGQGAVPLELTGDSFSAQSTILLNNQLLPTQLVDSVHLRSTLPNQRQVGNQPIKVQTIDSSNPSKPFLTDTLQLVVEPQPLAFSPANLNLAKDDSKTLTVRLVQPAPEDVSIKLASSNANIVSLPSSITIPAGSQEVAISLKGVGGGVTVVTASQDGYVSASAQVAVEVPMAVKIDPSPLVLGPNNQNRSFVLNLSRADSVSHQFTLSIDNPSIATLTQTAVEIPAGQLSVPVIIKGLAEGYTQLRVSSPLLGNAVSSIYVSNEYQAMSSAQSDALGVYVPGGPYVGRTDLTGIVVSTSLGLFVDKPGSRVQDSRYMLTSEPLGIRVGTPNDGKSPYGELFVDPVGIAVGPVVSGADKAALPLGQTFDLVFYGANLNTVNQVKVNLTDGIGLGAVQPAADGLSVTVSVTVSTGATVGPRKFTLLTPAGVVQESRAGALRLMVNP